MLKSQRRAPKSGKVRSMVVFVHGYGADGADLLGLADPLAPHLPDTVFYSPDAPEPCANNPFGFQWFPIPWLDGSTEEQARAYMRDLLPTLDYWKRYDELSDNGQFEAFKRQLIQEINDLHVEGLPKVEKLNALVGRYVNLAYPLPSGAAVNFLNDQTTYLGTQLESEFGGERCFGVLAGMDFILISTYGPEGEAPELVLYKKR